MSGPFSISAFSRRPGPRQRALLGILMSWPASAQAAESVHVACPQLSAEQAGEVEARIRASLLTTEMEAQVAISCELERAKVRVNSSTDSVALEIPTTTASLQDDLVSALERALRDLSQRHARSQAPPQEPEAAPAPDATLVPEAKSAPSLAPASPAAALPADEIPPGPGFESAASTQVFAHGMAEWWPEHLVVGAVIGAARGTHRVWYGASVGALTPAQGDADFSATELHGALRLGWQPAWASGTRVAAGAGLSLLWVTARRDLTVRSKSVVSAFFAELSLDRPIWFGQLALVPGLGLRFFFSERGVNVDARERLTLGGLAPQITLGVSYRTP